MVYLLLNVPILVLIIICVSILMFTTVAKLIPCLISNRRQQLVELLFVPMQFLLWLQCIHFFTLLGDLLPTQASVNWQTFNDHVHRLHSLAFGVYDIRFGRSPFICQTQRSLILYTNYAVICYFQLGLRQIRWC